MTKTTGTTEKKKRRELPVSSRKGAGSCLAGSAEKLAGKKAPNFSSCSHYTRVGRGRWPTGGRSAILLWDTNGDSATITNTPTVSKLPRQPLIKIHSQSFGFTARPLVPAVGPPITTRVRVCPFPATHGWQ